VPVPGGGFAVDRMYCSLQRGPRAFAAVSLAHSAKDGATRWYRFPDEPYLSALRPYVEGAWLMPGEEVLRYVPLRRFTFRGELRASPGRVVIGKFKRRSRVQEAHRRAVAVDRAVTVAARPFRTPAPLGVDVRHSICFQGVLPGRPLSDLVRAASIEACMGEAASLLLAFHGLDAVDLPSWNREAFLARVALDAEAKDQGRPEAASVLESARRALDHAPAPLADAQLVSCHGDFVCSHLLRGVDGWSIIDLDLAQRAEPLWEVAMAAAALARDVPALAAAETDASAAGAGLLERAQIAFVDAYAERVDTPLDLRRLRFWRLCAEIYELALMLTKDRYDAVAFSRALARVEALGDAVLGERRS